MPGDVLEPTVRQTFNSRPKNYFLYSDSDDDDRQSSNIDFIDKNLELEIGWALNPIRKNSKPVSLLRKSLKSFSNSNLNLTRVSHSSL